ncbi:hypothetical protein BASA81_008716 [Batrachochytrium salamandrivorans]|nr:hypothetical protein BASA81_008716 [Batrachochytrium salamandrivorans]
MRKHVHGQGNRLLFRLWSWMGSVASNSSAGVLLDGVGKRVREERVLPLRAWFLPPLASSLPPTARCHGRGRWNVELVFLCFALKHQSPVNNPIAPTTNNPIAPPPPPPSPPHNRTMMAISIPSFTLGK